MKTLASAVVAALCLTAGAAQAAPKPSCAKASHSYTLMLMARSKQAKTPAEKADKAKATAQLEQAILAQCTADQGETRYATQVSCYGHDKLAELAKCPKDPMNTWISHAIAELKKK